MLPFLPPIVHERRDVEMHRRQKKAYEQMRDLMIARLDAGVLMAANPMVQVGRLHAARLLATATCTSSRSRPGQETGEHKRDPVTGDLSRTRST